MFSLSYERFLISGNRDGSVKKKKGNFIINIFFLRPKFRKMGSFKKMEIE